MSKEKETNKRLEKDIRDQETRIETLRNDVLAGEADGLALQEKQMEHEQQIHSLIKDHQKKLKHVAVLVEEKYHCQRPAKFKIF